MTDGPLLGVVIVAAGSGVRFGDAGKALIPLAGVPMLSYSLSLFGALSNAHEIVIVAAQHTREGCSDLLAEHRIARARVVQGGATRADSVRSGLSALGQAITHVVVHDAARPFVSVALAQRVIDAALATGAAIPVVPVNDTLHSISPDGLLAATPDRSQLRAAQTPQVARRDWLEHACRVAAGTTDEGGLLRAAGYPVTLVDGDPGNLKITWPEDLALAEAILALRQAVG